MRIGAGVKLPSATLLFIAPDTSYPKQISRHPRLVDAFPPFMYLEPTETVAQAPRFARHLIDKRRHSLDLTARKTNDN
jgi:hypothetical protein